MKAEKPKTKYMCEIMGVHCVKSKCPYSNDWHICRKRYKEESKKCPSCGGTGEGNKKFHGKCSKCGGSGEVEDEKKSVHGKRFSYWIGKGKTEEKPSVAYMEDLEHYKARKAKEKPSVGVWEHKLPGLLETMDEIRLKAPIVTEHKDSRGTLVAAEGFDFPVKRVFWLKHIRGERGGHAHYKIRQYALCVQGTCDIVLEEIIEKKSVKKTHKLKANQGVLMEPRHWVTIKNASLNCIILVLASGEYDELDYIRDHQKYVDWQGGKCCGQPLVFNQGADWLSETDWWECSVCGRTDE